MVRNRVTIAEFEQMMLDGTILRRPDALGAWGLYLLWKAGKG